ncbi:MAG: phospholipid carrier-dependent glycosyltransferase [Patescibacteria group bacterium]
MKRITYPILVLIVLLGGFLRIYNLSGSPPSLNWDEAAWGYNAYSISETLRDEYGQVLPVFTRSFDEYKSTLPLYLMIPSIKIFGLNELGVRFPSAFVGTLAIILIFLLTRQIFRDERMALISSFVFAIEPWAVHLSRVYYDANEALFFLLLGFLLFLCSQKKHYLLVFSTLSFMLSMYTYNANKLLIPLFLTSLVVLSLRDLKQYPRRVLGISLSLLVLFLLTFVVLAFAGQALARVESTNIFIFWPKTQVLQSLIEGHPLSGLTDFFLHNQFFYFIWEVVGRYFAYLSPHNLFLREPQEPSTIVVDNSIFHPLEFTPWIVGLIYLMRNIKKHKEFLALLVLSPLPAIITWNWFQPGRTMALFAGFSILIGVGVIKIAEYLKIRKVLYFPFVAYGLVAAFYLFDSINVQLPIRDAGNWQPGFREAVPLVMELEKDYDKVIIETPQAQPYIFYLFYGKYSPEKYLAELDLERIGTPRKVYDFGKFKFRKIYWPEDGNLQNTLFVGSEENLPRKDIELGGKIELVRVINDRWGGVSAKIVGTK